MSTMLRTENLTYSYPAGEENEQPTLALDGVTLAIDLARPADGVAAWRDLLARNPDAVIGDNTPLAGALAPLVTDAGHELHKQGKHEAALQAYEEALRIDPDFAPAREARDALLNAEAAATVPSVAPPPLSENAPARP